MKFQVLTVVILYLHQEISTLAVQGLRRTKRIIGGRKLLDIRRDDSGFKAVRYMVWTGLTWNCHEDITIWRKLNNWLGWISPASVPLDSALAFVYNICPLENPNKLHCGGALITPNVVQTACHCVVQYEQHGTHIWGKFTVQTNWEHSMIIYMGQSDVHGFYKPVYSKAFAAHEKCGKMQIRPELTRYDFGWIVLETSVPPPPSFTFSLSLSDKAYIQQVWGELDYAGPYKKDELDAYHEKVVEQRHVCLTMGFGCTEMNDNSPSRFLKVAWVQLFDYTNCFELVWRRAGLDYFLVYDDSLSWICTQPLRYGKGLGGQHWSGDSGSPVTCNNNYIAIISAFTQIGNMNVSRHAAIKYAPEANTVEERRLFEGRLQVRYNPENLQALKLADGSFEHPNLRMADQAFLSASHSRWSFATSGEQDTQLISGWLCLTGTFMHLSKS